MIRRCAGLQIEEVAIFQLVIAKELVERAVEAVRARLRRRVDHRAVAAELRAIGVGQRLEFGDRFHAHRCAQAARSGTVVPEIHHVLIVQKIRLSGGTSTRDRILRAISVKRAARAGRARGICVTPGASTSNCVKLRPLSGISLICFCSTSAPTAVDCVSTWETSPDTVTVCVCWPTGKREVHHRFRADGQCDAGRLTVENPVFEAEIS